MNDAKWIGLITIILLSFGSVYSYAVEKSSNYLYQMQVGKKAARNSCTEIFSALHEGRGEDIGGIVRNLRSINVHYLLEDYDNALSTDQRNKGYLTIEQLRQEVAADKRGIYCRIELAIYLRDHEGYAGPAYDFLLDEAFHKLEETYASAMESMNEGNLDRAAYAFDLIAPYRDARQQLRLVAEKIAAQVDLAVAESSAEEMPESVTQVEVVGDAGPIAQAAADADLEMPVAVEDGPIARASRPGPVTEVLIEMQPDGR